MTLYVLAHVGVPQIGVWGMHPSLPCTIAAAVAYVVASLLTPPPPADLVQTFWGRAGSQ
jgi:hypothetical protein